MWFNYDRPILVEYLKIDIRLYSEEKTKYLKERYEAKELEPSSYILEKEGLQSNVYQQN